MGWIEQKPYIHPHASCAKPDPGPKGEVFGKGSLWECDICHRHWRYDGGRMEYDQHDQASWFSPKWTLVRDIGPGYTGVGGYGGNQWDR